MSSWSNQEKVPFGYFGVPMIDDNLNEIIIAPEKHCNASSKGLLKYDIINNKWNEWIIYPETFESTNHSAAIDNDKKIIYIIQRGLLQIDLINKTCLCPNISSDFTGFAHDPCSVVINNKLHIIGSWQQNGHFIYDKEKKTFIQKYKFPQGLFTKKALIYLKNRNELLLMAGLTNDIYSYSIDDNKWSLMDIKFPMHPLYLPGYIVTSDEKFVILFGGNTVDYQYSENTGSDTIHIMDIETKQFRLSAVKCPIKGTFRAVLVDNQDRNELIVNGYLRECWNTKDFIDIMVLPNDLIEMISKFHSQKYVHIMQIGDNNGDHWRILLSDILR